MQLRFKEFRDPSNRELHRYWEKLSEKCENGSNPIFSSPNILKSYQSVKRKNLEIFVFFDGDLVVSMWALQKLGKPRLYMGLNDKFFDHNTPIFREGYSQNVELVEYCIDKILANDGTIILTKCIANDILLKRSIYNFKHSHTYMCDGSESLLSGVINKKRKNDVRRQTKRIEKDHGKLEFTVHNNKDEKTKKVIDEILDYKNKQYQETKSQKLSGPDYDFYRKACIEDMTHISSLKIGNSFIAGHIGYSTENILTYLIPVYNKSYQKYSPGWILLTSLFEHSDEKGINYFDLSTGSENYKKTLVNDEKEVYYICLSKSKYRFSARLLTKYFQIRLDRRVRKLLRTLIRK